MQLFLAAKSWRTALIAAFALFVATRAVMLMAFPIFNEGRSSAMADRKKRANYLAEPVLIATEYW